MAVTEELLELEHAGWRSLCDGSGDEFYGGLMTDDALMVDVRLIEIADDLAALVYTGKGWRDGQDQPPSAQPCRPFLASDSVG